MSAATATRKRNTTVDALVADGWNSFVGFHFLVMRHLSERWGINTYKCPTDRLVTVSGNGRAWMGAWETSAREIAKLSLESAPVQLKGRAIQLADALDSDAPVKERTMATEALDLIFQQVLGGSWDWKGVNGLRVWDGIGDHVDSRRALRALKRLANAYDGNLARYLVHLRLTLPNASELFYVFGGGGGGGGSAVEGVVELKSPDHPLAFLKNFRSLRVVEIDGGSGDAGVLGIKSVRDIGRLLMGVTNAFPLRFLERLMLSQCNMEVIGIDKEWCAFDHLQYLVIDSHKTPITPQAVRDICGLRSLKHVLITASHFDDQGLAEFFNCQRPQEFQHLDLEVCACDISGSFMEKLKPTSLSTPSVRRLVLGCSSVAWTGDFRFLQRCKSLWVLELFDLGLKYKDLIPLVAMFGTLKRLLVRGVFSGYEPLPQEAENLLGLFDACSDNTDVSIFDSDDDQRSVSSSASGGTLYSVQGDLP